MMWLELRLRLAATIMVKSRPFWAGQVFKVVCVFALPLLLRRAVAVELEGTRIKVKVGSDNNG